MTVRDLLYVCANVDEKTLITVLQASGKELVSQKKISLLRITRVTKHIKNGS